MKPLQQEAAAETEEPGPSCRRIKLTRTLEEIGTNSRRREWHKKYFKRRSSEAKEECGLRSRASEARVAKKREWLEQQEKKHVVPVAEEAVPFDEEESGTRKKRREWQQQHNMPSQPTKKRGA